MTQGWLLDHHAFSINAEFFRLGISLFGIMLFTLLNPLNIKISILGVSFCISILVLLSVVKKEEVGNN